MKCESVETSVEKESSRPLRKEKIQYLCSSKILIVMTYDFITDLVEEPGMSGGDWSQYTPFEIRKRAQLTYSILPYYLIKVADEVSGVKLAPLSKYVSTWPTTEEEYNKLIWRIDLGISTATRWTKYPEFAMWGISGMSAQSREVVNRLIEDYWGWGAYEIMGTYPRGVVVEAVRRYLRGRDR